MGMKTVRKLAAVGAGMAMLGATAMGALAADLNNYPEFLVADGTFDGFVVVGDNAKPVDNLAATDIVAGMRSSSGDSGSEVVTVDGDSALIGSSADWLELNESVGPISGNNGVIDHLDDSDLGALADGTLDNAKGSFDYEQRLHFEDAATVVEYAENDDNELGLFYLVDDGNQIARYELDFTSDAESDIDASDSNALDDFEDKTLTVLGRDYTITKARWLTSNGTEMDLQGGSVAYTLEEGEGVDLSIGDVSYRVENTYTDSTEVILVVNGESTGKLEDGETTSLQSSGIDIGVSDIQYQDYAGGIHAATFFLGANKITFKDTEIEDAVGAGTGTTLKVNEETIDGAVVDIKGTVVTDPVSTTTDGELKIDLISVNMTAQDDYYVPEGGRLSEDKELDEPELLFAGNWDILFAGLEDREMSQVMLDGAGGDDEYKLSFTNAKGVEYRVPILYVNGSQPVLGDKEGDYLVFQAGGTVGITDDDFFVLATKDVDAAANDDAETFVMQYLNGDDSATDEKAIKLKDIGTGEVYDETFQVASSVCTFDLSLGGKTFNFQNVSDCSSDDWSFNLTSTDNAYIANGLATNGATAGVGFRGASGELIQLSANATGSQGNFGAQTDLLLQVSAIDTDLMDDNLNTAQIQTRYNLTVDSNNEVQGARLLGPDWVESDPDDSDLSVGYSSYGSKFEERSPSNSPEEFTLWVPGTAARVLLHVTSGASSVARSVAAGDLSAVNFVGATKLASEVADLRAQNAILVGGPCVNPLAAEAMGNPANCADGFKAGVARVKLFEWANGNVAMLVAGYNGADTRLAGKFIQTRWSEMSGMEGQIEGTSVNDAVWRSGAPAAPAAAADDAAADDAGDDAGAEE